MTHKNRHSFLKIIAFFVVTTVTTLSSVVGNAGESEGCSLKELKLLPVQNAGRVKPFDTFARESLQLIYGRHQYKKRPAVEVVFTWSLAADLWGQQKILQIRDNQLRKNLNLENQKEIHHSVNDLSRNKRVGLLFQKLSNKQANQEKLDSYFQSILTLRNQMSVFYGIAQGSLLRLKPQKGTWQSVDNFTGKDKSSFQNMINAFIPCLQAESVGSIKSTKNIDISFEKATKEFSQIVHQNFQLPSSTYKEVKAEVHYNHFMPNMWAWIGFLLALLLFGVKAVNPTSRFSQKLEWSGYVFTYVGLLLMVYGMALRIYIINRPPVTNMYETVIWVPFVTVIASLIIGRLHKYKTNFVLLAGLCVGIFCLILSDLSPAVLDPTLTPLEPVLRDNFWLITHVIMIVSSYGAFFLAFALGDLMLFYLYKDPIAYKKQINQGTQAIYRAIQVGVVLLAGGTILGGIWADYSWGRFWGWDPKETWAFIALMGYLALLHGRLTGWFKNLGMAAGSVLNFLLVIMAWYGVNFVLGAGLHSYGFGAGGLEWVVGFCLVHMCFVGYAIWHVTYFRKR